MYLENLILIITQASQTIDFIPCLLGASDNFYVCFSNKWYETAAFSLSKTWRFYVFENICNYVGYKYQH